MIDVNIFVAIEAIGEVLVIAGVVLMNPKGTRANLSLLILLVGVAFFASGLYISESKSAKGTPIEFSELKDQNYLLEKVPSSWMIVKIYSKNPKENKWRVIRHFPNNFGVSAKEFTKYEGKIIYPNKSSS